MDPEVFQQVSALVAVGGAAFGAALGAVFGVLKLFGSMRPIVEKAIHAHAAALREAPPPPDEVGHLRDQVRRLSLMVESLTQEIALDRPTPADGTRMMK